MNEAAHRKTLIVIHGWGGTFAGAASVVERLLAFECRWSRGVFRVERRVGFLLRQLLADPDRGPLVAACRDLVLSRFLEAPFEAQSEPAVGVPLTRFRESTLAARFPEVAFPLLPGPRRAWARRLREEALARIEPMRPVLAGLQEVFGGADGAQCGECEARRLIAAREREHGVPGLLAFLELLRAMHESGGDLDTVAAAALYAYGLGRQALSRGSSWVYGRDYAFVFVNYHESLVSLGGCGAADLYLADLPVGAFPALEADVCTLHGREVQVAAFVDHHPYTREQRLMLERLQADGLLGLLDLSGPLLGEEQAQDEMTCATDLVYRHAIDGRAWDGSGAETIRRVAHAEDLVTERTELGHALTVWIKGEGCKAELAQVMADSIAADDLEQRLEALGVFERVRKRERQSRERRGALLENMCLIRLKRPCVGAEARGGSAIGRGSDLWTPHRATRTDVRILVVLSVAPLAGQPRMGTGDVCEFVAETFPEVDYLFYCYGASLLVARRINTADFSLNLGALMPQLGGAGDGGHGGAGVCRPEENPRFPARLFSRVDGSNFTRFCRYLGAMLERQEYPVINVRNVSRPVEGPTRGRRRMAAVAMLALVLGALLAWLVPVFRPSRIREANRGFYPGLDGADPGRPSVEDGKRREAGGAP